MNEEEIREKVIDYAESKGVKYTFIANSIGVDRSTLCHFLKNNRKIADKISKNLSEFLLINYN